MADIYFVYAKEDRETVKKLDGLLSEQWDTWWDDKITGRFANAIEKEIPKAGCIVALFSTFSRSKDTVTAELRLGQKHNIEILPVRLDNSDPPYPFDSYSYTEMRGWNGEHDHPGFMQLQRRLAIVVPPRAKPQRPPAIILGKVPLPSVFMSISSYETQLNPLKALKALSAFGTPNILISAYDLAPHRKPQALIKELKKYRKNGGFVLVDSGNYEASRLGDQAWGENDLEEVLVQTPHDWSFCFDKMNPSKGQKRCIEEIVEAVERQRAFSSKPVLPIVHAQELCRGGYKLEHIPSIVREVSEKLKPPIIAIPERELGAGIIARAQMVQKIRKELNKLPNYQPLHLLGTGHPWSIAILAAAGADTFDGLEWCRFTIDPELEEINHFHHFDLLSELGDPKIGVAGRIAFHNLEYFKMFGNIMHDMFSENSVESFVRGVVSKKAFITLKGQLPELFK